jgi:hypothetical protein
MKENKSFPKRLVLKLSVKTRLTMLTEKCNYTLNNEKGGYHFA